MNSFVITRTVNYSELEETVKQLASHRNEIFTYAEMTAGIYLKQELSLPPEEFYFVRFFFKQGELTVRPKEKDRFHLVYIGDDKEQDFLKDSPSLDLLKEEDRHIFLEKRPFQLFSRVTVRKYDSAEGNFYRWMEVKK